MAQTALEWFINGLLESNYITKDSSVMNEFIEQAEAMEKEQIMDAYWNGTTNMEKQEALSDAEKFYNEYYTKNNR